MEVEYERETQSSSEEDEILERNIKKLKDNSKERAFTQPRKQVSYKDSLIEDIPGHMRRHFILNRTLKMLRCQMMKKSSYLKEWWRFRCPEKQNHVLEPLGPRL